MRSFVLVACISALFIWSGGESQGAEYAGTGFPSMSGQVRSEVYRVSSGMGNAIDGVLYMPDLVPFVLLGMRGEGESMPLDSDHRRWDFGIAPVAPNPVTGHTRIAFSVPGRAGEHRPAVIEVFDIRGRLAVVILDEDVVAGEHEISWDLTMGKSEEIATGIYFIRMSCGNQCSVHPLIVLR